MRVGILTLVVALTCTAETHGQQEFADEWLETPVDDATFESYLGFFAVDHDEPLDAELLDSRENDGLRREEWSFTSTPGERVYAHFFTVPSASPGERAALVMLHPGKDLAGAQHFFETVARGGFDALAIDMKYWGRRATDLLTTYTEKEKHDRLYNRPALYLDWMVQSVKDVERAVDFLLAEKDTAPERIALNGVSRGAVVGAIAGAVEKRFATVVLMHGGHFDGKEREHLAAACPANYIGRIRPVPLLTLNGVNDSDFVAETSSRPLSLLANEPKKHIWTDGGHGQTPETEGAALMEWLQKYLN